MEENVQVMTIRRAWQIIRVTFFMLRKNITKRKLLLDLKYLSLRRSGSKLNHHHHRHNPFGDIYGFGRNNNTAHHVPSSRDKERELDAVNRVLEMIVMGPTQNEDVEGFYSPVWSGFGFERSPEVRVTDSPYPVHGEAGNYPVDQAAEDFIQRFYSQLNQQRITDHA